METRRDHAIEADIARHAAQAFAKHELVRRPDGSWRCGTPGNSAYLFFVYCGPGVCFIWGDVGEFAMRHADPSSLHWLLTATARDYVLGKITACDGGAKDQFLVAEAIAWLDDRKAELLADAHGEDGETDAGTLRAIKECDEVREALDDAEDDARAKEHAWWEAWSEHGDSDPAACRGWTSAACWLWECILAFRRLHAALPERDRAIPAAPALSDGTRLALRDLRGAIEGSLALAQHLPPTDPAFRGAPKWLEALDAAAGAPPAALELALRNCLGLAQQKIANPAYRHGDWVDVVRFCAAAGVVPTVVRDEPLAEELPPVTVREDGAYVVGPPPSGSVDAALARLVANGPVTITGEGIAMTAQPGEVVAITSDGTSWTGGGALIDASGTYRYRLTREWGAGEGTVVWIMLNPSTADAAIDDPTIRRIVAFSQRWSFKRLVVVNLFAFRASNPSALPEQLSVAAGFYNDVHIAEAFAGAGLVMAAWGAPTGRIGDMVAVQADAVIALAAKAGVTLSCLGTTAGGGPKHPLARGVHRVPDDTTPTLWRKPPCP